MEKLDLEAIRRRIDKIDAQLVAALEERMEAVLEVAVFSHFPVYQLKPPHPACNPLGCMML